jgi:DNA-binding FadR family transcriptional regulator
MSEPGSLIRSLCGRLTARNYHSYVINEVGLGIASGRLAVGAILPNDAEMMDTYGVSRTVLREALKTLEAKGLVEARAKVGTRVLPKNRWNLFDRQVLTWIYEAGPEPAFVRAFAEVRRPLELEAAELAAKRRTAEQLRMLSYWQSQRSIMTAQPEPFALAEFEVHRILGEASMNPFLRAASGAVEFGVLVALSARLPDGPEAEGLDLALQKAELYQDLLTSVEAGTPERARATMEMILEIDFAGVF